MVFDIGGRGERFPTNKSVTITGITIKVLFYNILFIESRFVLKLLMFYNLKMTNF